MPFTPYAASGAMQLPCKRWPFVMQKTVFYMAICGQLHGKKQLNGAQNMADLAVKGGEMGKKRP